ncbi:GNAT family N-acetyltransferase [Brachybacterium phenoliresistens]|uniref:GNAT family acetyltransferase n=1 Tax=Brachybacterium phenoliresistens TaxID=396014 RepID=Z9JXK8_9MICO|nr:GNAT family N-acetyltransferase [Brachybacterium phenoliresistens]EWS82758.1 GNAT family acetyltransferase [Brachybacterium phenoliresistens]
MTSSAELTVAPLSLEDAPQIAALLTHLEAVDGIVETFDEVDVREILSSPGMDPAADSRGVRIGGDLVAIVWVGVGSAADAEGFHRAEVSGGVHAEHRRRGIGARLLAFAEDRAAALMRERHPGAPHHLRISGGVETSTVRHLLRREGYAPARSWLDLARDLPGESLPETLPPGVELAPVRPEDSREVRLAHLEAFRDHWGSAPIDEERWASMWDSAKSRHDLGTVARDAAGKVVGYVLAAQYEPDSLYVALVGTVPAARGRGIARAMLASTIRRAAEVAGLHEVTLEVDSESLTGATRLYEGLGFRRRRERVTFQKDVPASSV